MCIYTHTYIYIYIHVYKFWQTPFRERAVGMPQSEALTLFYGIYMPKCEEAIFAFWLCVCVCVFFEGVGFGTWDISSTVPNHVGVCNWNHSVPW